MTDPSFAGQLIAFTYPHIGNYGVSSQAMESERPWARAAIMRAACASEDAPSCRGGWLRLALGLRCAARSPASTPLPGHAHPRGRGDARRRLPGVDFRVRGARTRRCRAADGRTGPRADRHAGDAHAPRRAGRRAADRRDRHRDQGVDGPRAASTAAPASRCTRAPARADEILAEDPDAVFLANGPGDPAALDYIVRDRPRDRRKQAGVGDLPRPPAALPRGRPRDVQASVRPPRRQPPGPRPAAPGGRDHLPEPRLRGARPGRRRARSTATSRCAGRPTSAPPRSRM